MIIMDEFENAQGVTAEDLAEAIFENKEDAK